MNKLEERVQKLNELITKNYDAEEGYKKAADLVEDAQLKSFFRDQAKNRYDFGHSLKDEIKMVGGEVKKGTSVTGDLHRTWMSIKDAFSGNDEKAMLEEVIRGEKASVEEYRDILKDTELAPTTKELLTKQVDSVQGALAKARTLDAWEDKK